MEQAGAVAERVMGEAAAARHRVLTSKSKTDGRKRRQRLFLEMIENGRSITEASEEIGMSPVTYSRWRQRYPDFRAQMDALRLDRLADADAPYQGDFISFRLHFFGFQTYWHQREIIHAIETAKGGEVVLVLVPPEHGKTTVLGDYVCYKLGTNPDFRITYISEGQHHTKKFIGRVQRRMTDPNVGGEYIARFGPFYVQGQEKHGKPWTSTHMSVFKYGQDEQDFSLEGRGWRSTIAGTRTDLMLVDDMQSRRSLNLTEAMVETFRQDFLTRPGRDGVVVIVMTRVGLGDFPERLQEEGVVDKVVSLPALGEDDKPLCPELWPADALAKKREKVGPETWARNYMQSPRASMEASFTDQMIEEAWDLAYPWGKPRHENGLASLDPAITGGNALTIWGYDTEHLELVDVRRRFNAARIEAILDEVEQAAQLYEFQDLVIETNSWQKGLREDERFQDLARTYGFRVHEHVTGNNKYDDDLGVARMPTSFIKHEIVFPGADDESRQRVDPLVQELLAWQPDIPTRLRRQDCVMSMWFAWLFWLRRRGTMGGSRTFVRSALPWAPTQRAWKRSKGLT